MDDQQLKAKVVRGVGWSTVQAWGLRLTTFLVYPILARLLGPEAFGIVASAGIFIMFLDVFSDVSFGAAVEQRRDLEPLHLDSIFWAFLGLGVSLSLASVAVGAPLVARYLEEPILEPVVRWLTLSFLLQMITGVQVSLLRRQLRIKELAAYKLVAAISGGTCGITMALNGFGVWSLVGQRLVTQGVLTSLLWIRSDWRPGLRFSRSHFLQMSRFGLPVMGDRLLMFANRQVDQLLVRIHLGSVALGYYFNASRLQLLVTNLLVGSTSQVAMPAFAQLQDDRPRFQRAYAKACRLTSLVAFPAFVGLTLLSADIIVVVIKDQWLPSAPALSALALAGIALSILYINSAAMMALGRTDLRLGIQLVHTVANLIGFFLAVRHGFVAVAIAYTVRAYLLMPLDLLVNQRLGAFQFRTLARVVRTPLLAVVIMAAVVWWLRDGPLQASEPLVRLLVCVGAGAIAYVGICLAVDRGIWGEWSDLARQLAGRRRDASTKEPR
jgi:PST family polysaccharide transporter